MRQLPTLDNRDYESFYMQMLALAQVYCPEWISAHELALRDIKTNDVGITLIKLAANLADYLAKQVNKSLDQRLLAFLKFLGLQLRLPQPAQAPLTFYLESQAAPVTIVAETKIEHQANLQLIFQTLQDIKLLPVTIVAAVAISPYQDQYADTTPLINYSNQAFPLFGDINFDQPLNHLLYLGDDNLFANNHSIQGLKITLSGNNLLPEYFSNWIDSNNNTFATKLISNQDNTSLTVEFITLPQAEKTNLKTLLQNTLGNTATVGRKDISLSEQSFAQEETYWLGVKPLQGIKILPELANTLPILSNISCFIEGSSLQPEITCTNDIEVNGVNGIYPFGEMPKIDDSFYIGSDEIFSKQGADVVIDISVRPISLPLNANIDAQLTWEFWDGSQWQSFNATESQIKKYKFIDTAGNLLANNLNGKNYIAFSCPNIQPTQISGQNKYWIRVRIGSGTYSHAYKINDLNVEIDKYYPPYIRTLSLSYNYNKFPQYSVVHNNFKTANLEFKPYEPVADIYQTFYLGFDISNFSNYVAGNDLSLFFYLQKNTSLENIEWEYYNGNKWQKLIVKFNNDSAGLVQLSIPKDIVIFNLFNLNIYWLRLTNKNSNASSLPYLQGIYPNTTMVANFVTIYDEILGSGTGKPSQTFQLSQIPILDNVILGVFEPTHEVISSSGNKNTVQFAGEASDKKDDLQFIVWQEVENFVFSKPDDRHYVLNHITGLITFGDDIYGKAAPEGINNIVAKQYKVGGGQLGNCASNTLTKLQLDIPEITRVTNPDAAYGGTDGDNNQKITKLGPGIIKARTRAVTKDDFVTLAMQANTEVIRAAINWTWDKKISLYILAGAGEKLLPSKKLLEQVENYIKDRSLITLTNFIEVLPPHYFILDISVQLNISEASLQTEFIQNEVQQALRKFLHPINGNTNQEGWNFGQYVATAELIAVINKLNGIKRVLALSINGNITQGIQLANNELPSVRNITVDVYQG